MSEIPLNADTYSVRESFDDLKKNFIDDQDPEILELGLYGWISAILSKETSSVIRESAEMANEMFPDKARLESSIMSHAVNNNITDIFATPAKMQCILCIIEEDLEKIFENQVTKDNPNSVVIDNRIPIYVEDYEYHLEYPIIISRTQISNFKKVYTARYDISDENTLSEITNPYMASPYIMRYSGYVYLFIPTQLAQYTITERYEKFSTDNIIDNKSFDFTFEGQLAAFDIYVKDGDNEYKLKPIFESENQGNLEYYCRYNFISADTIRVKFDSNSYIPGLNAEVTTVIKTTEGSACNFTLTERIGAILKDTEDYSYFNTQVMIIPQMDSAGGKDRISTSELKKMIPKEANSRGNLTSYKDLNNYFNRLNSDTLWMTFDLKVNNQFMFEYYSYILSKDANNNVVPTNTISLVIESKNGNSADNSTNLKKVHDDKGNLLYIMNPGLCFGYNGNEDASIIHPTVESFPFKYTIPFKAVINPAVPAIFYYMNIMNEKYILNFNYINDACPVQFIATNVSWRRDPSDPINGSKYLLDMVITQNVSEDYGLVTEPEDSEEDEGSIEEITPDDTDEIEDDSSSEETTTDAELMSLAETESVSTSSEFAEDQELVDDYINANDPSIVLKGISSVYGGTSNEEADNAINENNILGQVTTVDGGTADDSYYNQEITEEDDEWSATLKSVSAINALGADTSLNTAKDVTQVIDPDDSEPEAIINVFAIAICKKEGVPVRWFKSSSFEPATEDFSYTLSLEMYTDDSIDIDNNICIKDGKEIMSTGEGTGYIYFPQVVETDIYILARFNDQNGNYIEYGRDDLDSLVPKSVTEGYTVTNKYTINGGIEFYDNFSNIISSIVTATPTGSIDKENLYRFHISEVPVIGYNYAQNKEYFNNFIEKIKLQKSHIDNMLEILDNPFTVDFKFYNTYGTSKLYTVNKGAGSIGKVNISLEFNVFLQKASDTYTVEYIKRDIKEYIESFTNIGQSIHIPNIIANIMQTYSNSIYYIEYKGFNVESKDSNGNYVYGPGCQHFYIADKKIGQIPEFINVAINDDNTPNIIINVTSM